MRASLSRWLLRRRSVLPGLGLSLGVTVFLLSLVVVVPLVAAVSRVGEMGWQAFLATITARRVVVALELTLIEALGASLINAAFGLIVAWVLVRYQFASRRVIDALIDLPFALPTAVAGIALAALYAPGGWIGRWLPFPVAFTPLGILVALVFIGLPFVVRTLQPVIESMGTELEEAAATLGAGRVATLRRVVLPVLAPALLTGTSLAFARSLGEYGSVIFIAGNIPMVSEIAPLLVVAKLEQYDYAGATAISVVMLAASFALLLAVNGLQGWARRRQGF